MSIEEKQKEIVEEFSFFDDWQERYEHLILLGKSLPKIEDEEKEEKYIIKGCQSKVWLKPKLEGETLFFTADSDAILPKGIAALLVNMYSGHSPLEIAQSSTTFISDIGLHEFLSPTRANGLLAMVKQIKFYAVAMQLKQNN